MQRQDAQFYVSIKGIIFLDDRVLLLRKPSGEWDIPGGRLSIEENPKQCLIREVLEETGLTVKPGKLLHRWIRRRPNKIDVFLVSHICKLANSTANTRLSIEHDKLGWFSLQESEALYLPEGIYKSVQRAFRLQKKLK